MYCLTVNLTSDEWIKICKAAPKQSPQECLSRAEIVRRYTIFAIQALKSVAPADQERLAHGFQASCMEASNERLKL